MSRKRVLRGGSWNNDQNNARAANRNRNEPDNWNDNDGFRCAQDSSRVGASVPLPEARISIFTEVGSAHPGVHGSLLRWTGGPWPALGQPNIEGVRGRPVGSRGVPSVVPGKKTLAGEKGLR